MIWKDTTIACDYQYDLDGVPVRCRNTITEATDNSTEARQLARAVGWRFRKGPRDYCPIHKDTRP